MRAIEVIHCSYERKGHLPPVDQDGQQEEGCLGERREKSTQVECAGKVLECDVHVDHTAVVAQAKRFMADCTSRRDTDASVARCVGRTTDEFGRWMTREQDCIQMERRHDKLIHGLMLGFEVYYIEKPGTTAEVCDIQQMGADEVCDVQQMGADETENENATVAGEVVVQHRTLRTQKPSDDEQKARRRALYVGRHLYNMDASMGVSERMGKATEHRHG